MERRFWTEKESKYVCRWYLKKDSVQIAKDLNRSLKAVYFQAKKLGLTTKRSAKQVQRRRETVRKYHAKGWSDSEIAKIVRLERRTVGEIRLKLGLPSNRGNERHRRRVAATTKLQLKKAGLNSLAEVRSQAFKKFIVSLGWPPTLSTRAAQIAHSLWKLGPMSRKQIAAVNDFTWRGSRQSLTSSTAGGSYLAELQRAGIVVRLGRVIAPGGSGRNCYLYMIAPEICPSHQAPSQLKVSPISKGQSRRSTKSARCRQPCDKPLMTRSAATRSQRLFRSRSRKP